APPWAVLPRNSLCSLTALQPRPKTVAASGQSLSQHSCRDSDTRARGSQSQRRIATENVPNFLGFLFGQRLTLTTLGHCERPPTRVPLAPLARPESVDVHSAQVSSDLAALGCALLLFLHNLGLTESVKQRLTLASLGSPKTPADSDLARSAREALVGGRFW
ncbi:hypothetical protein TYRP_022962, partial [Tyrophagus putrescentiae]